MTWSRRRKVLAGVVAIAAVVVGAAAVLVESGGVDGGSSEMTAIAPAYPGPSGSAMDGARGVGGIAPDPDRSSSPGAAPAQGAPVGTVARALVRTAALSVEVEDPAASSRQVATAAAAAGAIVTEERSSDTGGRLVLRVPADSLDRLVEDIAGVGKVTGRSTQVTDATEETVDLGARVASQQASVARVRALLSQAGSIGDVVAIESELSRREADLDSLTSRLDALRDQVALSTLTVDLRGPGVPPVDDRPAPGFLDGLTTGWDGLRALGTGVAAVIGFVLPFLPVLAVLGGIGWLARRAVRTRRPAAAAGAGAGGGRSGPGSEGES